MHHSASILSIGDELVRGQSLDTNSRWLSERLLDLGIETLEHVTIPDDVELHASTLRRLAERTPLIISTGGLGPTADDLTRDALSLAINPAAPDPLVVDGAALHDLEAKFAARGRTLSDLQRLQATRPSTARCLPNPLGTAPGLAARVLEADVFCLPGPPREMCPMFEASVRPLLRPPTGLFVRTRVLHMIGIGEGDAAKRAAHLMPRDPPRNPLVGITASGAIVSWRLRARASSAAHADALLAADESELRAIFAHHVFGADAQTLPATIISALAQRGETLAVCESCTAGLLGAMLTEPSGASAVFQGGLITYSNTLKQSLAHVSPDTLAAHGAVSREVASEMAQGTLRALGATHALAITGIAGPTGGSPDKPVGTVWIALASAPPSASSAPAPIHVDARRFLIPGDRADIRERAARSALAMLHFHLAARSTHPASSAHLTQPSAPLLFQTSP